MTVEARLHALKSRIGGIVNDDVRYAVSARIRELGYIDLRDFYQARPAAAHVAAVEQMLGRPPEPIRRSSYRRASKMEIGRG